MDLFTQDVVTNLQLSYQSKSPINAKLIDSFILSQNKKLDDPSISSLISIINQILSDSEYLNIDSTGLTIQLLGKILSFLTFGKILNYYPQEFILENLYHNNKISVLCMKILTSNMEHPETIEFLSDNEVIPKLIELYFNVDTSIEVVSNIETLIKHLKDYDMLRSSMIYISSIKNGENTTLLTRYIDLIQIVSLKTEIDPSFYIFDKAEILKFSDDVLFLALLVQFYENVFDRLKVESSIKTLILIRNELHEIVQSEIINMISIISYSKEYQPLLKNLNVFKTYNLIKLFDKDDQEIKLLATSDPALITSLNPSIYEDILSQINLFDKYYFSIFLNFIKMPTIFIQLGRYVNNEKLSVLPLDMLYRFLLVVSREKFLKEYLFNNLPNILTAKLLEVNISNTHLWNLKLEILQNLISDKDISGYDYWEEKIKENYDLMRFGRSIKNTATVDVIDETMN